MAAFPGRLIPALTAQLVINEPSQLGPTASGGNLMHVQIVPNAGFLRSEPDYPIKVDAVFLGGHDFVEADPDDRHVRLDVQSLVKDLPTQALLRFSYTGTIDTTGPNGKVLRGDADAKTTDFGQAFTHITFETGHADLAALRRKVYLGSGRFILEAGKPVVVEYKISELAA